MPTSFIRFIGYPKKFHADNGKEFTAKCVLQLLRNLNPNILTVTGCLRRPRDQGSVKNVNKLVKRILGSILAERRILLVAQDVLGIKDQLKM